MNRADRKKFLIAQGAIYRAEVMLSKQALDASLQPEALARSALQQIAHGALSVLGKRGSLPGINLQTLLPLAITGISALAKRKGLLKVLLRGAAVAGAAASVVALVARRKRTPEAADNTG